MVLVISKIGIFYVFMDFIGGRDIMSFKISFFLGSSVLSMRYCDDDFERLVRNIFFLVWYGD